MKGNGIKIKNIYLLSGVVSVFLKNMYIWIQILKIKMFFFNNSVFARGEI